MRKLCCFLLQFINFPFHVPPMPLTMPDLQAATTAKAQVESESTAKAKATVGNPDFSLPKSFAPLKADAF